MAEIAVLGFGVVGSGTVEVLDKNSAKVAKNAGQNIRVKYILDIRDFSDSPFHSLFVNDFETIVNDPDISVVVEVIGGVGVALEYTQRCLEAGKSVVTSNKELVAAHGYSLLKLAREKGVNYLFEASVGGGIPIMRPLVQCMAANQISEIFGILNGTTNYILTEMEKNGAEFEVALKDAQLKGYAEADPTADVEGHDACRKICILASLAFGKHVYPDLVSTEGIRSVTKDDKFFASELGYKIKLLGRARVVGDKLYAYVASHLIDKEQLLSGVEGVMNGVVVRGNAVGDVILCGAGAGKLPTASAVVADIIDAVKHLYARKWIGWEDGDPALLADPAQLETAWYIRTDAPKAKIEREFGDVIFAGESNGTIAFKTMMLSGKKINDILARGIKPLSIFRILV
ncbi:MAG: homoserine dehydrogenase [Oscillospiraceae bacterium]|nr:homoserine dehydrogenase [Oscillospiraceae bacterium]